MGKTNISSDHKQEDRCFFEFGCFNYIIHIGFSELLIESQNMTEDFYQMIHHSVCKCLKVVRTAGFTEDEFKIEVERQLSNFSEGELYMHISQLYGEYL